MGFGCWNSVVTIRFRESIHQVNAHYVIHMIYLFRKMYYWTSWKVRRFLSKDEKTEQKTL